jgi:hypothetical protein
VPRVQQRDLKRWKLLTEFRALLAKHLSDHSAHSTGTDPKRKLTAADYYSSFLFGLFNPVVHTLRGLCQATHLPRVHWEVCARTATFNNAELMRNGSSDSDDREERDGCMALSLSE